MCLIYFYSHDGEGLGHLRRNLNIADYISAHMPEASAMLLTGCIVPGAFGMPPRCDTIKMPTLRKFSGGKYRSPLTDNAGQMAVRLRRILLETTIREAPPDLLIVERHAQGLDGELLPALHWLKSHSPKTRVILGLRDVLDSPEVIAQEWSEYETSRVIERYYDKIWLYTDNRIFPTAENYDFAPELKTKGQACGYVVGRIPHSRAGPRENPFIIATVGGGSDGRPLLDATCDAVARLRDGFPDLQLKLFAGPLMKDEDYITLRDHAGRLGSWIKVDRFSQRLKRYIRGASAVVTMGGYNTMVECVAAGCPTVVVPRQSPREEQLIRARAFERHGFVRVVRQDELEGSSLMDRLAEILESKWRPASIEPYDFDGCQRVVHNVRRHLSRQAAAESSAL